MKGWFNLFGWLLSVLAAAGNTFVVFLVAKTRRLHYPSNWFVLSLAVVDFGVGIVVFPISYLCNLYSKSCKMRVYMAFYWFLVHSSVTNLCCLTWDRYTATVHPFKHITSMTARRPRMVISISWLILAVISFTMVMGMYFTNSETAWKVLSFTGVSAFDLISGTLLFYAVARILIVTRVASLKDAAMGSGGKRGIDSIDLQLQQRNLSTEAAPPRRRKKYKTARFIIALGTFFLGCYVVISYLIINFTVARDASDIDGWAGWAVTLLLVANSTANPLACAFLKRDIKKEITRFVYSRGVQRNIDYQ